MLDIDLDTCQTTIAIHGDGDLQEGTVILPLESLAWYGFPRDAIPLTFRFQGFISREAREPRPPAP